MASNDSGFFSSSSRFTFLATLFLLLFVSTAIVLRSFFLRRRFRRRIEEAIAAGAFLPPAGPRVFRKQDKPALWDACLSPARGRLDWACLMPVAGRIASRKPGHEPSNPSSPPASPAPHLLFRRMASVTSSRAPTPSSPSRQEEDGVRSPRPGPGDLASASALQLSMLIAMPNPRHPHASAHDEPLSAKGKEKRLTGYWDEEEDEGVPDVVLGMAQVGLRDDAGQPGWPS